MIPLADADLIKQMRHRALVMRAKADEIERGIPRGLLRRFKTERERHVRALRFRAQRFEECANMLDRFGDHLTTAEHEDALERARRQAKEE